LWHTPNWDIIVPANPLIRWSRMVRPQDVVWLLLFILLAVTSEIRDAWVYGMLAALAAVQVLESKVPALATIRGRVLGLIVKFALCFLLIGYTFGIDSRFWLLLLLPVVSAATVFGILGTMATVGFAAVTDLAFIPYADWSRLDIAAYATELTMRVAVLAIVGTLANTLAEDLRVQSREARRTAAQLVAANEQVQEAQEAVRRSDRLAALGQLSAGLAHELRNPLGTIRGSAEMLSRTLTTENDVAREMAGYISAEVDRANSLITRFLQFARPLELRPERADLTQTLDRAVAMVEREAPNVSIYKNYAPEIPPFVFDPELLERVIYNLVLNAAQATPAGGAVTVKTRTAGRTVEIAVVDRGTGIEPRHLDTIFNPFFTTKPDGVGLGLAIVAKIVDEHGGKIAVESEPKKGSIFRVLLPMDRPAPAPAA
jgi:two-component system, NtrC family, sensor histidine kinase HydH